MYLYTYIYTYAYIYMFFSHQAPRSNSLRPCKVHQILENQKDLLLCVVRTQCHAKLRLNHAFACQKKMFWQCCSLIANRSACDGLKERHWEATTKSRRILLQHSSAPSSHLVFTNGWDTRILCANPVFMEALQKLRKVQSQQGRRFGRLGTQQALRKSHQSNIWELRNGFH